MGYTTNLNGLAGFCPSTISLTQHDVMDFCCFHFPRCFPMQLLVGLGVKSMLHIPGVLVHSDSLERGGVDTSAMSMGLMRWIPLTDLIPLFRVDTSHFSPKVGSLWWVKFWGSNFRPWRIQVVQMTDSSSALFWR